MVNLFVRARPLAALAAACVLSASSGARADGAVLATVSRDDGTLIADSEAARRAALGYFGKKAPAVRLFTPEGARPEPPEELRGCRVAGCAGPLARAVAADFAVLIHVSSADGSNGAGTVSASFVTPVGLTYVGKSNFGPGTGVSSADVATANALASADDRYQRGPGPWLQVVGPEGARVSVDGNVGQVTPYVARQSPGMHRVIVTRPDGSSLYEGVVTVDDDLASYEVVDTSGIDAARDERVAHADARTDDTPFFDRPRSRNNLYVGIPLTALGLGLTIAGITHYAQRGECADSACSELHTVNALSRALVAGGATLTAGAGISFLALGVLREPATSSPQGAVLHVQGRF